MPHVAAPRSQMESQAQLHPPSPGSKGCAAAIPAARVLADGHQPTQAPPKTEFQAAGWWRFMAAIQQPSTMKKAALVATGMVCRRAAGVLPATRMSAQ